MSGSPPRRRSNGVLACVLGAAVLLSTAACSRVPTPDFEPDGGTYSIEDLEALSEDVDLSSLDGITADEAPEMRSDVLVELRTLGEEASDVADMLTRDFPAETRAVPVSVIGADYDGEPVWIVVEGWGDEGDLVHTRVWVFEKETGMILWSASTPAAD